MTGRVGPSSRWADGACLVVFLATCLLYGTGAIRAAPGVATATLDFEVLARWRTSGRLEAHPTDRTHLTKPGHVALLRAIAPSGGRSADENRRFLILNAVALLLGAGLLGLALRATAGRAAALLFLLFVATFLPLRDASDYVAPEALATGLGMAGLGALILGQRSGAGWWIVAGVAAGLLITVRPNEGAAVALLGVVLAVSTDTSRRARLGGLLAIASTTVVCFGLLAAGGYRTRSPLAEVERVLLWGTTDYYWTEDVDVSDARTAGETAAPESSAVTTRWSRFFQGWNSNRLRSLEWKALHGLISTEELPPRLSNPRYLGADRLCREWWWLAGALLLSLSAAAAAGGTGPWRFMALLVAVLCVAQSVAFGADPRLVLPFLPLLVACMLLALPTVRWRAPAIAASGLTLGATVLGIWSVPDIAGFDFALVRAGNRQILQRLPSSRVPPSPRLAVHFRVLQGPPHGLGFVASIDGETVLERPASDPKPYPAFFSAQLSPHQVAKARREGLSLTVETTAPSGTEAFLYFPVSPAVLGLHCLLDGSDRLPSGFHGTVAGGWPVWVTAD